MHKFVQFCCKYHNRPVDNEDEEMGDGIGALKYSPYSQQENTKNKADRKRSSASSLIDRLMKESLTRQIQN